ncbi:MAG TPA: hypothetical protein VMV10_22040 [Pirellulales bacterium]|nr:hypothetical protein [Pirellulales bacterium]
MRKSNPELVVDGVVETDRWHEWRMAPNSERNIEFSLGVSVRQAVQAWKEKQAGK